MSIGKIVYDTLKPLWIQARVVSTPNYSYPLIQDGVYLAGIISGKQEPTPTESGVAGIKME